MLRGISRIWSVEEHHLTHHLSFNAVSVMRQLKELFVRKEYSGTAGFSKVSAFGILLREMVI